MSAKLVWFITGASSGFGLELSLYALKAGHTVIGTIRNRERAEHPVAQIEAIGGKCTLLDINDIEAIPRVVEEVIVTEGRIDVLVNSAGYSLIGAVEDISPGEAQAQFTTNFFGPLRLIQSVIPHMREKKSGTIVNISSSAGLYALPACGLYSASKFALEGLSESLFRELSPFNINVLLVEPGAFRTNFIHASVKTEKTLSSAYATGPLGETLNRFDKMGRDMPGDPAKAAKVIFEAVTKTGNAGVLSGEILRLPLGSDGSKRLGMKIENLQNDFEKTKEIAKTTDFAGAKRFI